MSSGVPSVEGEPPRKRVRKGTRSCWECKRRKVRCQLSSEDVPVCSGCLARGTTCLSQEYPEERDTSSGGQVGERLGRVERLLETLVAKIESFEEDENVHKIMTPESVANDVLTPYTTNASANPNVADNAPFLSLFENSVFGRRDNVASQATSPAVPTTGTRTPSCRPPKLERIRQALADLLPSQQDTDLIRNASSSLLLLYALNNQKVEEVSASTFNIAEVSKRHPTSIARSILYIAICLQQLDSNVDTSRLHLLPTVDARIDKYMSTVQSLVTSDEEMVSTTEGLECLILQGSFHINAGNPRRAWLTLRRALNLGQLMGIHRKKGSTIPGGREMWFHAVQADRYLGLLLGLPCGSADFDFGPEETFQNPNINLDELFNRKLCNIVGRVIERNQSENSQVYATTQNIDEMLENLHNDMPKGWWDIPAFIPNDGSLEAAQIFKRIMSEMWFYQVLAFLHLPFMLRASKERRYEYSRFSCLKASREMIDRYLALRRAGTTSFCCNVVDFGALTSTITLYLVSVMPESETGGESQAQRQQRESDKVMIQAVLKHMEELSQGGRDLVATQSVNVIKSLLAIDSPDSPSSRQTGNLKLTIPYFGTISIVRPSSADQTSDMSYLQQVPHQSLAMGQELPSQSWQNSFTPRTPGFTTQTKMPMISFMSSQFPEFSCQVPCSEPEPQQQQQIQDWSLPEDNFFFDSLLQTDLEGNWIL